MNYYISTNLLEGCQTKRFLGIPYGLTQPKSELISVGIVREDGAEYYAVSEEFNLREAWDREDVRETVLKSIWEEWVHHYIWDDWSFNYSNFKKNLDLYGKSAQEIQQSIYDFTGQYQDHGGLTDRNPTFYTILNKKYLFFKSKHVLGDNFILTKGLILNLIEYLKDSLYGDLDDCGLSARDTVELREISGIEQRLEWLLKYSREIPTMPLNDSNALNKARHNKQLHEFILKLKGE